MQIGNVVTLAIVLPCLMRSLRGRSLWLYPALLAPLVLATLKVAVAGGELGLCFKSVIVWALSCLAMTAVQLRGPRHANELLTGIASATLLHAAVGLWQLYCFAGGVFPMPELYVNPSFLSVQDNASTIARYTQRPFGVFPEPSAMSSSLAPWVLFWAAHLCGLVRLKTEPAVWQRRLYAAAAAGGLGLIILSRSGHAAVTVAAVLAFAAVWLVRSKATGRTYLTLVAACCVVLPAVLWFAAVSLGDRLGGNSELGNSSWEDRSQSLVIGFSMLADGSAATVLFGMGPGLSGPALWNAARLDAVWSVLLAYVYETGIVGAAAAACVGQHLLRVGIRSRGGAPFVAIALVWLVGVTLTTSYEQLLSLWLTLGWLTVWPAVCEPAAAAAPAPLPPAHRREPTPPNPQAVRWGNVRPVLARIVTTPALQEKDGQRS